jgi:amidase
MKRRHRIALAGALLAAVMSTAPVGRAQTAKKTGQPFEVVEATVDGIHAAFKSGQVTAHQLVQMYLDRIEAYNKRGPMINAIITLNPRALEEADRLDAAYRRSGPTGPLHGIPILVKDEVDAAGMPTTLGTLVFKDYRPPLDAFAVDRLKKAGAIILGKTTLSEFAGGDTYGSMFGITRNPYGFDRTVGGSSGGSGASLAANFSTLAVGEETSASIRRPGGWNAVVALRPTPGLVSRTGMWDGYPRPNAQMGPMARTVGDLAKMLDVMVGYDAEDPLTALGVGNHPETYTTSLDKNGLKGARLGVIREIMGSKTDPNSEEFKKIDAVFQQNVAELKAAGATIVDNIIIPDLKKSINTRGGDYGGSSDEGLQLYLSRNPNSPFKTREDIANHPDMAKSIPPNKADQWKRPRQAADPAKSLALIQARDQLAINVAKVMADNKLDAFVYKTVEYPPTLIEDGLNPPYTQGTSYIFSLNTFLIYASVITVPSGFTTDGLPSGITFFGRPYAEPTLLKLAYAYEQATHHRMAPKTAPALASVSND